MLNYWRGYAPDFAARTARIRQLLSADAAPWGLEHSAELKSVVEAMLTEVPTLNFSPEDPVVLETHVGPKGLAAVYLQRDPAGGRWLPVASYSRELATSELRRPVVVLEAAAVQEAALKLSQVSVSAPEILWMVSPGLHALLKARNHLGPELTWRVADALSWGMTPTLQVAGETKLPAGLQWDPENDWAVAEGQDELDPGFLQRVQQPARLPRRGQFQPGRFVHVQFDGGAAKEGLATAGYLIVNAAGREVVRRGVVLGRGLTNNDAESAAIHMALQNLDELQRAGEPELDAPIRALGDS